MDCKVLLLGKTGGGKSSLVNYLCGVNTAKTGIGQPVSGREPSIHKTIIGNKNIYFYDTWGLEVDKQKDWTNMLENLINQHGIKSGVNNRFHSIFYCINAAGQKVEDVDIEVINNLIKRGFITTIVLTKADTISEEDENVIKKCISNNISEGSKDSSRIVSTCTVKKTTKSGVNKPFGKSELIKAIFDDLSTHERNLTFNLRYEKNSIKFYKLNGTVQYVPLSHLSIEHSKDDRIIKINNGWVNAFDEKFDSFSDDQIMNELKQPWGVLRQESTNNVCPDHSGYCKYKTDEYYDGRYRCNNCFFNRHRSYVTYDYEINEKELDQGIAVIEQVQHCSELSCKTICNLKILYDRCKKKSSEKIKRYMYMCDCILKQKETIKVKFSANAMKIAQMLDEYVSIFNILLGDKDDIRNEQKNIIFEVLKSDVSAVGTNIFWGNSMRISIGGYNKIHGYEPISFSYEFDLNEWNISKSSLVELINSQKINILNLSYSTLRGKNDWRVAYQ